jgi:hypothetical protein
MNEKSSCSFNVLSSDRHFNWTATVGIVGVDGVVAGTEKQSGSTWSKWSEIFNLLFIWKQELLGTRYHFKQLLQST